MAEMKACLCCGTRQSGVDQHNDDFEMVLAIATRSASEMDLVSLVEIITRRFVTQVTTSEGEGLLAYKERELANALRLNKITTRLLELLAQRNGA